MPEISLNASTPGPNRSRAAVNSASAAAGSRTTISAVPTASGVGDSFSAAAVITPSVPLGPDQEVPQIIAGVVLAQPFQPAQHRAIGQHRLDPQTQIARIAMRQHRHPAGIGRQQP